MDIVAGIEIFLYAVCMAVFFYPFMVGKKEQTKSRIKKVLMVFLIYTVMYFVNMSASVYGWLCMIIVLILLVAVSKFLDMDKEFTFFLGAIFFCIRHLSVLIMGSISYFLGESLERKEETAENFFGNAARNYVFIMEMQIILFIVMLYAVVYLLKKKTMKLHIKELCYGKSPHTRRSVIFPRTGLLTWQLGNLEVIYESGIVAVVKNTVITPKCPFVALTKLCLNLCRYIQ